MKRVLLLFVFYIVGLALVSNIITSAVSNGQDIEVVETEETEKGAEETDFEKDKIFLTRVQLVTFSSPGIVQRLHPPVDISTLVLDADINPPDRN